MGPACSHTHTHTQLNKFSVVIFATYHISQTGTSSHKQTDGQTGSAYALGLILSSKSKSNKIAVATSETKCETTWHIFAQKLYHTTKSDLTLICKVEIFVVRYGFDWHIVGAGARPRSQIFILRRPIAINFCNTHTRWEKKPNPYGFLERINVAALNCLQNVPNETTARMKGRLIAVNRCIHKLLLPAFTAHNNECKNFLMWIWFNLFSIKSQTKKKNAGITFYLPPASDRETVNGFMFGGLFFCAVAVTNADMELDGLLILWRE